MPPSHRCSVAARPQASAAMGLQWSQRPRPESRSQSLCFSATNHTGIVILRLLTAQDGDEAPHGVRLPTRGFHDLRECGAFRAPHHGDHLGLLVGAIRLRFAGRLLGCGPSKGASCGILRRTSVDGGIPDAAPSSAAVVVFGCFGPFCRRKLIPWADRPQSAIQYK